MVIKLVGKMLLKVTIPFVILAGVVSYGMHHQGGDPVAMWKGIGSNIAERASNMASKGKDNALSAADSVAKVANVDSLATNVGSSKLTRVFTWKDANGVTQYSNMPPNGVDAKTMSINPNTNVLAPIVAPKAEKVSRSESKKQAEGSRNTESQSTTRNERKKDKETEYSDSATQDVADELGGELPGVLGQVMSTRDGADAGAINPAQLLKMLQQ